ncbi:MAG: aminotransferase class V-fold PLP-dependent enzyme [Planctomycetota bacterium]|nr:aminotransferase class V-fold PLP-dependent enzyme [Planctomycetota bacterium]
MKPAMIYFDNAATSFPKAPGVSEAIGKFIAESAANPGRAGHRLAVAAEHMIDDVRLKLTRLLGGQDPRRMVFTLNGTDALNMAIHGVLDLGSSGSSTRPHVITTVLEHNSVSRPLVALAEAKAIDLTRVDCDDAGFVDPAAIKKAITPATALIVMTHASNVLGTIQDAAAVGRIAREHDILFCLDAAQTAGVVPISVEAMNIDLLAFPGHKSLLGPTGTGGLYVGPRCPEPAGPAATGRRLRPWREGGTGGDSSTPTQPQLFPYFLEGGTPNTVGLAGLGAGVDYVATHMAKALAHEQAMVKAIIDRFADDERFTVHGTRDASRRVGTVSLSVKGFEPPDVGSILDDSFEIAVRPGLHCSPYAHKRLGTFPSGTVRVSPGPFNTEEQLATLLDALDQIATA